ncbi:MAG TPA: hypothetical protein VFU55_13810 [Terracidiphilus sp.]|nr:hypothetical protein [Terracidiphilus sp.]
MPRLLEHINFSKIVVILASTFGVALGACGLTALVSRGINDNGQFLSYFGLLELAVMILSSIGLVLTIIIWVIASIFGNRGGSDSEPIRIFDNSSEDDKQP